MRRIIASIVFLTFSGCGFPGIPWVVTKSNFEVFEMTRSPGLGFCIDPGMVMIAVIQRSESGARLVSMHIAGTDIDTPYECREGVILGGRCLEVLEVTPRDLTPNELGDLENAFQWMGVGVGALSFFTFDTCLVTTYRWDGFEARACPCGNSLNPHDQERIEYALLSLAEN